MKSLELLPTEENLMLAYEDDYIGRNTDIHYFFEILNSIDDCCIIALDGKWGSGKTFFVKQTKMLLDAFNDFVDTDKVEQKNKTKNIFNRRKSQDCEIAIKSQVSVYYDAWENDNDDDPLLSLIFEIAKSLNTDFEISEGKDFSKLLLNIFELFTGKNIENIVEFLKKGEDPFLKLKSDRSLIKEINAFLDLVLVEKGDRLVIFIDELDRCKPSYAVKLLERIKHYFQHANVTFVLSINSLELQHTIKQYYGLDFDAYKYLDRFFDLKLPLPKADLNMFYSSIGYQVSSKTTDIFTNAVINYFNFEMREIAKYIRLMNIVTGKNISYTENFRFCFSGIVPIIIGLRIHNINMYYDFIEGRNDTILQDIFLTNRSRWMESKLLDNNEYMLSDYDKNKILKEKIHKLYDALFNEQYITIYKKNIGSITIDKTLKNDLFKVISLLSPYSDYT